MRAQEYISRVDLQAACVGEFDVRFQRGWMLERRLEERNTVVLSKINFEHFCGDPKFDLCSDTNYCAQKSNQSHKIIKIYMIRPMIPTSTESN